MILAILALRFYQDTPLHPTVQACAEPDGPGTREVCVLREAIRCYQLGMGHFLAKRVYSSTVFAG